MKHKSGWQLSHETLEHYRFRAVALWKEGKRIKDVAHFFGLHRVTVSYWISAYKQNGKQALKSRTAAGPEFKLQEDDVRELMGLLKQPATDFGFETPLWTCKRVRFLIRKKLHKRLDNSNVWRLLKRWFFTNQKPERRAAEQDPKEARRWLREEWPKIKAHARRWQAIIYFQDEAGVSLILRLGKTWAPKGRTPVVKVTGNKGGFCVTSAISPGGRLLFRIEEGYVNAEAFTDFLNKVLKHHPQRKIIVVTDKAPAHTAGKVHDFVEANQKRFALYYLPAYSPELNPDENVWGYLKEQKLKTHQEQTVVGLKKLTFNSMKSIQMQPTLVQSFFTDCGLTLARHSST